MVNCWSSYTGDHYTTARIGITAFSILYEIIYQKRLQFLKYSEVYLVMASYAVTGAARGIAVCIHVFYILEYDWGHEK